MLTMSVLTVADWYPWLGSREKNTVPKSAIPEAWPTWAVVLTRSEAARACWQPLAPAWVEGLPVRSGRYYPGLHHDAQETVMSQVPAARQPLEPAAADAVRAYAARTRAEADRFASALEDIAANGLPAVEECVPWEELREADLARLAAQRPAVA
jgi:hypothetical protein